MDEVCAEVKNTTSHIAELLAIVKRSAEVPQQQSPIVTASGEDVPKPKRALDGKLSPRHAINPHVSSLL